jgi:xanthine/uracil/vitamin C permease (AzgA family)
MFVMIFVDTMGTLIGLSMKAGLLDRNGNLPIIVLMSFTYNIGIGMTAGFVVYPVIKTLSGRSKEVPAGLWVLGALSLLFFVFYPY